MHIRQATPHDIPWLIPLFEALGFQTSAPQLSTRLATMAADTLVVCLDAKVIGVATLNVMQVLHRPTPVGRVSALVVDAAYRGLGYGGALLRAAEHELQTRGCALIEITSNVKLTQAHQFYQAHHYQATSYRFKKDV